MGRSIDSSVTVAWMRRVVSGSVICGAFRAVVRGFGRLDTVIGQAMADRWPIRGIDETRVREVVGQSWLVQALDRMLTLPGVAWESSAAARKIMPVVQEIRALEPWQKVRLAGWMLAVGLLAHAISHALMGAPIGRVTIAIWAATGLLAVLLMAWGREIVAAWLDRARRRSSRS